MAIAPVNKFISLAVPVAPGEQKLYEVPTGTSSLVLYAQVANVGVGTYPTVTFIQRRETRSTGNTRDVRVIKDVEIPPNDAVILIDGRMVLEKTPLVVDSLYVSGIQSGITTISNVLYHEPTGVVTVTTMAPHGFDSGSEITMAGIAFTCPPGTGITTTIFPDPQKSYVVDTIVDVVGTSRTFTSVVGGAVGYKHVYNPAIHSFLRARKDAITYSVGSTKYTPTDADYNPSTGIVSFTLPCHDMLDSAFGNDKDVGAGTTYNADVGILTVTTTADHGFFDGDLIKFDDDSIKFKCSMDNYAGIHTYPRASDPTRGVWLGIGNTTPTTFEVNVGKSPSTYFDVTDADYEPSVGILTCTIGSHNLKVGNSIRIANNSISFQCSYGSGGIGTYPRNATDDPGFSTSVTITAVTENTISLDVLKGQTPTGGLGIHTFVAATPMTITDADYTPSSGIMTCTIANHGMYDGDAVKIANNSITFSCGYCGNIGVASQKSYPRTKDPISDTWVAIANTSTNTFEINVGTTDIGDTKHYFESANSGGVTRSVIRAGAGYTHLFDSAVSGGLKHIGIHSTSHGKIAITNNSLFFSCSIDNYMTEHSYPRATDPVSGINTAITRADYNSVSAYVGTTNAGGLVGPLQMEFLASILENSNA